MRKLLLHLPVALCALALCLGASEKIKLASGKVVSGTATAYDSDTKTLTFVLDSGVEKKYTLDQLDGRSVYLVHSSVIPRDNAKGQLGLANFARDAGLFKHAARRYGYAEKADPELEDQVERERAELRKVASQFCLTQAEEARKKGDADEEEKWLKILLERLPEEPQSREAATLLEASYTKSRQAKQQAAEAKFSERLQKDIARGKSKYEDMVESTKKGLTARNDSKAEKLWKSAIKDGEVVLDEIAKLQKKYSKDPEVMSGTESYRELTVRQMVEAWCHLASQALVKSSTKQASKYCNEALALDPRNAEALAMRARIEQASNEGYFGWYRGRRR